MMRGAKNILALAICAFASIAHGQTYGGLTWGLDRTSSPYKVGINLNGVWYNFGQITSAGVPTPYFAGTTCAAGQFFNVVSSTGQFTCTAGTGASVATNAALAASATATYPNGVWRTDYASGRGAPPLWFMPQTGNCAANSLVNDGGSCVNTTAGDGNSWKAVQPSGWANVLQFGATQDGVTDSTTAIQNAMNASAVVYFPKGTAFIAGNLVQTRNNIFFGDGNVSASVLKFLTGATGYMIKDAGFVGKVDRLEIDGGNSIDYSATGAPGTRSGIHLSAAVDGMSVLAANIHGFNNIGLGMNGNTSANNSSAIVSDSIITQNYCGWDMEPSGANQDVCLGGANGAEYTTSHGNQINKNRYGVIAAGNTTSDGDVIIRNGYGYILGVVGNSGH